LKPCDGVGGAATRAARSKRAGLGTGARQRRDVAPRTRNQWLWACPANVPAAEGSERIAPPQRPSQGDSAILQGSIASAPPASRRAIASAPSPGARGRGSVHPPAPPSRRSGVRRTTPRGRVAERVSRLTLPNGASYHPPDDERAAALQTRAQARLCAFRGRMSTRGPAERIAHSPDEADLSAQEAASREGARLPRPDEDDRRSSHHCRSAGPRAKATDGLTNDRGPHPPRLVMLSRPQEFAALQGAGTVRSHPLLTARFLRTDLETTRFGLATGRRLGGAVVRNRVRRRLREVLRAMEPSFQPGWDVLIIARPAIVEADHQVVVEALRRLLRRGGVLGGQTTA
jgi:ribonuclease P protein component